MASVAVAGKVEEYISNIDFSLNFEDQKKSTKVKIGDIVYFDGVTARHTSKLTGLEMVGKATPLKSAVNNNWLTLNTKGAKISGPINVRSEKTRDIIPSKDAKFDPLTGGSFEDFIEKEGIVSSTPKARPVIKEEDQVIKKTDFKKEVLSEKKTTKLEVTKDQVDVKDVSSPVTSSTSAMKSNQRTKLSVVRSEDGADSVIVSSVKKTASGTSTPTPKAKNSFTVDGSTPALPSDATMKEVRRAVDTVQYDESQDAKVVKKVGSIAMPDEPNEQEGIVLKKTDFSKKVASSGGGSTPVADLSGVSTQAEVDQIEAKLDRKEVSKTSSMNTEKFIERLPTDWSTLHWVKREKFIMEITEIDFLKYIMTVECTKAIIAACRKRMVELEKLAING